MENTVPVRFSEENEYWAVRAGSQIVAVIADETGDEDWSTNRKHLYGLENGKFAVVRESGCSCYTLADADIDVYESQEQAEAAYNDIEL